MTASPDDLRCICDPDDPFEPPDPTPRAVADCPAHRVRRAFQQWLERQGGTNPTTRSDR